MEEVEASLPSNYVTIHELKQRWLQQQIPKPTIDHRFINHRKSPSPPLVNVVHDSASETLLNVVTHYPNIDNHHHSRPTIIPSQPEPQPVVKEEKQHHRNRNTKPTSFAPHTHHLLPAPLKEQHQKPKYKTKTPLFAPHNHHPAPVRDQHQVGYRSRNQNTKHETKMPPHNHDTGDANSVGVLAEDSTLVKEQYQVGRKRRNKKVFPPKTPPFHVAANDNGVVEVDVEAVVVATPVKVQHQDGERSRSQKPKHESKTPPFAPENDGGGDVVAEDVAIAAPLKEQHKAGHHGRKQKPQYKTKTLPFTPKNDDVGDGIVAEDVTVSAPVKEQRQAGQGSRNKKVFRPKTPPFDVAGNDDGVAEVEDVTVFAPVKEQRQAGQGSRNKKVFRPKMPPFDAAGTDDGVVEVENVTVSAPVKEQHQPGRGSRNKKVFQPKTPLFDVVVDGGISSGSGDDDGVVAAVVMAASVEEIDVCNLSQRGYRREVFEGVPQHRTWYRRPSFGWKKEQISQVWVKKGESAPKRYSQASKPLVEERTKRTAEAKGDCRRN